MDEITIKCKNIVNQGYEYLSTYNVRDFNHQSPLPFPSLPPTPPPIEESSSIQGIKYIYRIYLYHYLNNREDYLHYDLLLSALCMILIGHNDTKCYQDLRFHLHNIC